MELIEKLQLQQYFKMHPIRNTRIKYRIAYISLIKYLCEQFTKNDQWTESMLVLMKELFVENENFKPIEINLSGDIIFGGENNPTLKHKFQKYRYYILTDCLFISAFDNREKGIHILEKVSKLYSQNKRKLKELFEYFYEIDEKNIKMYYPEMTDIYKVIKNNRNFLKLDEKKIMIIANMSAGKSTLLNALVGKKVNKTQNDTCTSKIHYLYNKAGEDYLSYELDYNLILNASKEILMKDNEDNNSIEITVGTRFRSINEVNNRICFIDTPGVNSSRNKEHKELTNKVVVEENCDLLLFLFNGENIGTDDERRHLCNVKEIYHGEIIFLINKLDRFKFGDDSVEETIKKVKDDLVKLGFLNPKVYPISAYAAYLAKMSMFDEDLTEDETYEMEFRKRKLSRSEYRYDTYFEMESPLINEENESEMLLKNSGILNLESMIYNKMN